MFSAPEPMLTPLAVPPITPSNIQSYTVANGQMYILVIAVVARQATTPTKGLSYYIIASFLVSSAGAITKIGSYNTTFNSNFTTASVTIDIATANTVKVNVSGEAATNISWKSTITEYTV